MRKRMRRIVSAAGISLLLFALALSLEDYDHRSRYEHAIAYASDAPERGDSPFMPKIERYDGAGELRVEVVARDLDVPWDLGFLPDGRMLVTERRGRVRQLRGGSEPSTWLDLGERAVEGEGGVLGIAVSPHFERDRAIFLMYTRATDSGELVQRISRFLDDGGLAKSEKVLVDGIPGARFHNGGALRIGPDGRLYAGTGDVREPELAQDRASLAGKILRLGLDGSIPKDNPFPGSFVWAYGFRNVSALAFRPGTMELWAATHGPSNEYPGLAHRDAIYRVRRGGNHGWPLVVGVPDRPGIVGPVIYFEEEAVPPGGLTFYEGSLFPAFTGQLFLTSLGTMHLQRIELDGDRAQRIARYWEDHRYGRLRAVVEGPDGALYVTTSQRDGRASRKLPGADFVYRIVPE